jgi:hypothetical protein
MKGGAVLRLMHGNESFTGRLHLIGRKVSAMQTFLLALLIWITPSFLFVGWRIWMSRPLRDVHYRHRWQYSHALTGPLKTSMIHFHDR